MHRKFREDPLVYTPIYQEFALAQNFARIRYIAIAAILLSLSLLNDLLNQEIEISALIIANIVVISILSCSNLILSFFFTPWFLQHPKIAKRIIAFFWIVTMIIDLPSFLLDARVTLQPLNLTTWLSGMMVILVLRRKQIIYLYSLFLLAQFGIAFYAGSPSYYFVSIMLRTTLVAVIDYFLQYPYTIAAVKNFANSSVDPLTKLMNRREGLKRIALLIETTKRTDRYIALFMIDIDDFKHYNDTFGHQIGDEVIMLIARCVQSTFSRRDDTNIRYGGEEILVCACITAPEDGKTLAENLHRYIKESDMPTVHGNPCGRITISIGYVVIKPTKDVEVDITKLIYAADMAMYEAKRKGKNCSVKFRESLESPA